MLQNINTITDIASYKLVSRIFNGPYIIDDYFKLKVGLDTEQNEFYNNNLISIKTEHPYSKELEEIIETYKNPSGNIFKKTILKVNEYIPKPKVEKIITPDVVEQPKINFDSNSIYGKMLEMHKRNIESKESTADDTPKPRFVKSGYVPSRLRK